MKNLLKIDIFLILAYLSSLTIAHWLPWSFLTYCLGIFIFFLPGLNLALTLEQLTEKLGRAKIALWTFLFSILLTPAFMFYWPTNPARIAQTRETLLAFFLLTFLSLGAFLIAYLFNKKETTTLKIPAWQNHSPFWIAMGIFALSLCAHFAIYPFIPEADSYSYLQVIEKTVATGQFFNVDNRSIFYALIWTFHQLTQISLYSIFRIVFPFFGIFTIIASYHLSSRLALPKKLITLASLSFFLFPVILQSLLTVRPQLLFLLTLPIAMLLLLDGLKQKSLIKISLLLLLAILGIKMHQAFIFLILAILPVLIYLIFKKYRITGISLFSLLFLIALILSHRNLFTLKSYFLYLSKNMPAPNFRLWFLHDYATSYGEHVSWPGFTFLYYYGNNLGFVFPVLLALTVWKKIWLPNFCKKHWPLILLLGIFLTFAEILPRLGINYEPYRFLLFSSAVLSIFLPRLIQGSAEKINPRFVFMLLATLTALTFTSSLYLSYSKQGLVNQPEIAATEFIQQQTPADAVFLTQGGNNVLVEYFYHRTALIPAQQFFLENQPANDRAVLKNIAQPTYILYSTSKFEGLRGGRDWWQRLNFFGADLAKFADAKLYEKVYDKGGVMLWKVK